MLGQRFVERMGSLMTATISCFDRVILTGYLPFYGNQSVNSRVDQELKIRRKDFLPLMKPLSDQLVAGQFDRLSSFTPRKNALSQSERRQN